MPGFINPSVDEITYREVEPAQDFGIISAHFSIFPIVPMTLEEWMKVDLQTVENWSFREPNALQMMALVPRRRFTLGLLKSRKPNKRIQLPRIQLVGRWAWSWQLSTPEFVSCLISRWTLMAGLILLFYVVLYLCILKLCSHPCNEEYNELTTVYSRLLKHHLSCHREHVGEVEPVPPKWFGLGSIVQDAIRRHIDNLCAWAEEHGKSCLSWCLTVFRSSWWFWWSPCIGNGGKRIMWPVEGEWYSSNLFPFIWLYTLRQLDVSTTCMLGTPRNDALIGFCGRYLCVTIFSLIGVKPPTELRGRRHSQMTWIFRENSLDFVYSISEKVQETLPDLRPLMVSGLSAAAFGKNIG